MSFRPLDPPIRSHQSLFGLGRKAICLRTEKILLQGDPLHYTAYYIPANIPPKQQALVFIDGFLQGDPSPSLPHIYTRMFSPSDILFPSNHPSIHPSIHHPSRSRKSSRNHANKAMQGVEPGTVVGVVITTIPGQGSQQEKITK